jgi:hypothetical protein
MRLSFTLTIDREPLLDQLGLKVDKSYDQDLVRCEVDVNSPQEAYWIGRNIEQLIREKLHNEIMEIYKH